MVIFKFNMLGVAISDNDTRLRTRYTRVCDLTRMINDIMSR